MLRGKKGRLSLLLAGIMSVSSLAGLAPMQVLATPQEEEANATLLLCSDFQTEEEVDPYTNLSDVPESLVFSTSEIMKAVYDAGNTNIDSVLMAGDYSSYINQYNYDADPATAMVLFEHTVKKQWNDLSDFFHIQGNHDQKDYPYNEGATEYDDYIVYCVNGNYNDDEMGGFPWRQGNRAEGEAVVKLAAEKMEAYFEERIEEGEDRPVFVMVHLPLHFSGRTSYLYDAGDNLYSSYLFNVINLAAEDLDIVYMFGHNHSKGWDSYMGGSRIFKQAGDTILIPDHTKKTGVYTNFYTEETLNFTYLNAGYLGYVKESSSASELTATVCSIYDDKLVFERYSKDGSIGVGANGTYNTAYDDSGLIPSKCLAKETASRVAVSLDKTKETSVRLEDAKGILGKQSSMHAVAKNMEVDSYEWSISDSSVAEFLSDGKYITVLGKKVGTTEVDVTVTDKEGKEYKATADLEITAKATQSASRTEEFIAGEKYMLVGGSQDYSSVRPAVTAETKLGNKGDGVTVLKGASVSGLKLNDLGNELEVNSAYLWTAIAGENGTVALYNEAVQKYMHFEQGNKSVTLAEEPTYFEAMTVDYADSYGPIGKAVALHLGNWYLNYSDRQGGFSCYDASAYDQDGNHFTNQYGLYKISAEKSTLNFMIKCAERLNEKRYTAATWSTLWTTFNEAKVVENHTNATQIEVDTACKNLQKAMEDLQETTVLEVFSDVYNDWYTGYVQYVYENSLMTGIKGTDKFEPNANITKAQVAQVLYNMEGQPRVESQNVFEELTDVYTSEWYANAVSWAYSKGVVTGDTNAKKFFPNADVTREQLALMMFRYAKYKKYDVTASSDLAGLKNAENVNNWALDGVKWAVGSRLISGVEKNGVKDLQPQGNASRGQVAAILQRFCNEYQMNKFQKPVKKGIIKSI